MLVVFASLNQVNAVRRRLERRGLAAEMLRTPRSLSHTGCSFALRCAEADLPPVLDAAREAGVAPGGVFAEPERVNAGSGAGDFGDDEEA